MGSFIKTKMGFECRGTRCSAWFYRPKGADKPPVVIMAHGLAAEKTFGLPMFAEAYAEQGYAVFLFDYRNHGDSEGQPRNLVRASRHVQDWEAALARVKKLPNINGERIILWGASFSGGHVLVIAARHPEVAAVISHVPFTDGITVLQGRTFMGVIKGAGAGIIDAVLAIGGVRCMIPVVAQPGKLGCINQPGAQEKYMAMIPAESNWQNRCPASVFLTIPCYRPIRLAADIKSPVLIVRAQEDDIISSSAIDIAVQKIGCARMMEIPGGHFDFYMGDTFSQLCQQEFAFLSDCGAGPKYSI